MREPKPHIGIFWYDETKQKLIGVYKCEEDDVTPDLHGKRVFPVLHKNVWSDLRSEYYNAYGEYVPSEEYPIEKDNPISEGDYAMVARGRVFSDDFSYQVFMGDWFFGASKQEQDCIKNLIFREFGLREDETDFIEDDHWNIGQGWGE